MGRLEQITLDELHNQLDRTVGNTSTQRVLAAIGRKQGATIKELAERHNVAEKTIRNWLDRFAEQPLEQAPYDDERPGRPPKLTDEEKEVLIADLHTSPEELGHDRQVWDPALVHQHVLEKFDVEYSRRHVYRLMDEAELPYGMPRLRHYNANSENEGDF